MAPQPATQEEFALSLIETCGLNDALSIAKENSWHGLLAVLTRLRTAASEAGEDD